MVLQIMFISCCAYHSFLGTHTFLTQYLTILALAHLFCNTALAVLLLQVLHAAVADVASLTLMLALNLEVSFLFLVVAPVVFYIVVSARID